MSIIATAVKHLIAAGVTGDALVAAIEEMEASLLPKRSKGAVRTERWRERKNAEMEASQSVTKRHSDETPSPLVPPLSPAPLTPPIIPPTLTPLARVDAIPGEEGLAFDAFNDLADEIGLPKAQVLTAERKSKLRQRLNECGGLTGWLDALGKIRGSPFLRGDNNRGWKANFDFVLQRSSFTRLMEGSYEQSPQGNRASAASRPSIRDGFDKLDAVFDEAIRRADGCGPQGSEEDSGWIPGLRKSAA